MYSVDKQNSGLERCFLYLKETKDLAYYDISYHDYILKGFIQR